jgi:hypothetical protein
MRKQRAGQTNKENHAVPFQKSLMAIQTLTNKSTYTPIYSDPLSTFSKPWEEQPAQLQRPELELWLDHYDDIYSDFDSRQYQKRRISEDFLQEIRMAHKHRGECIHNVSLVMPAGKHDDANDKVIAESIAGYFRGQYQIQQALFKQKKLRGLLLLFIGAALMILNAFISYGKSVSFPIQAVRLLLEPASWFLLWTSLDFLFYDLSAIRKDRNFLKEMATAGIHFKTAEI